MNKPKPELVENLLNGVAQTIAAMRYGQISFVMLKQISLEFGFLQRELTDRVEALQLQGKVPTKTSSFIMTQPKDGKIVIYKDTLARMSLIIEKLETFFENGDANIVIDLKDIDLVRAFFMLATGELPPEV